MAEQETPPPVPINTICVFCNQALLETEAKIQLHCTHIFHTNCFIANEPAWCLVCHHDLLPQGFNMVGHEHHHHHHRRRGQRRPSVDNRISELVDTNAEFKNDLKQYLRLKRICARKRNGFIKKVREKKAEVAGSVQALREQLKSLIVASRRQLKALPEHKELVGAVFRKNMFGSRIQKKYGFSMKQIRSSLLGKEGFKRWSSERFSDFSTYILLRRHFHRRYIRV